MISARMLPQTCQIYRTVADETKSYVTTSETLIATYACYISQKTARQWQQDPQNIAISNLEVLMNLPADIQPGDRLVCDGASYAVGVVYKPANRHIQADLRSEEEA